MKKINLFFSAIAIAHASFAQFDLPPGGNNPRATISEEVGITSITIKYSRPDVNGREGKIWGDGKLVTYGFSTNNFITNQNTSPWRAGANEATTITFEHDVKVEGQPLKAGTYGLFMAMGADNVTVIFSKQWDAWGSFYYDAKDDALRVNVKPVALDKSVEWLKYEFIEYHNNGCTIAMQWEKLSVPFKVDVDVDNIVLARLREQVQSQKGFNQLNLVAAANYCLNKNINLEEALAWAQRASALKSFATLNTLGNAYTKLNRLAEADSVMNEAVNYANVNQYSNYGLGLIKAKRADRALQVLLGNQKKFGDVFAVNNALMMAYSAKSDFKNALKFANKALLQAADDAAKKKLGDQITNLKAGKDINQ